MDEVKKRKFDTKQELMIILLSFSLSFTVLFFPSAEVYIRNQKDFLVSAAHIIIPMLIVALVLSFITIILLNLMVLINEVLYNVTSRVLFGLLLAFYIQELFFNGKMSAVTGDSYDGAIASYEIAINFIIFYVIAVAPIIIYYCKEKYPDNKFFSFFKNSYIISYLSVVIFLMQVCGLCASIAQFGWNTYDRGDITAFAYEPSMSLSKENNIVVFLLDRTDCFYMDEVLETYPELYDELDGFTFYRNNISRYSSTFPSVSNMFTDSPYEGESWNDYFDKAWAENIFLDDLKKNDWHINLFLDSAATIGGFTDIEDRCDNKYVCNESDYGFNYLGKDGIVQIMTKMSLARVVPYVLKENFTSIKSSFSSDFFYVSDEKAGELMLGVVSSSSALDYYKYIKENPMTNDNSKKTFTFVHLVGFHDDDVRLSELYSDNFIPGESGSVSVVRGQFEILLEYFKQMKELGIYDNSTIIILGDHGRKLTDIDLRRKYDCMKDPVLTGLLVKPANSLGETLKVDNTSPLSNSYFAASILDYANIEYEQYGYSYRDIIENDIQIERYYQLMLYMSLGDTNLAQFYKVTGDAKDIDNWEYME